MKRIEIVCDASIEDEMKKRLHSIGDELYYTSASPVRGRGVKGQRQGDAVWPEENALFVIYTEDGSAEEIRLAVEEIRLRYPRNGVAVFVVEAAGSW